jgi:hypothetical protein
MLGHSEPRLSQFSKQKSLPLSIGETPNLYAAHPDDDLFAMRGAYIAEA